MAPESSAIFQATLDELGEGGVRASKEVSQKTEE